MKLAAPAAGLSPFVRHSLLWMAGAALMVGLTTMMRSAAYADGAYVPSNADAFYHARRILDAVMSGQPVAQFDARMHLPGGSWVTWPWAYDAALAHIVRLFGPFASEAEANRILMNIPVAAGVLAVGLVVVLGRLLRLPFGYVALLVLGFIALPAVFTTLAVGNIDHHYAESLWTTLTLCAGIWFVREPRLPAAMGLGAVLGTASGIHTSLLLLQVPVVCFFVLQWLRGGTLPPARPTAAFGATLVAVTLAIGLGSTPLRQGAFVFYLLSWLHVYVAAGTALVCLFAAGVARRPLAIALLAAAGALAAWPLLGSLDLGARFVGGRLAQIRDIQEIHSPYWFMFHGEFVAPYLLWLLWLAAPATAFAAWLALRHEDPALRFFGIAAALGLALAQLQARLHVFGELALVAVPLLAAHAAALRRPRWHARVAIAAGVVFALAISPATRMLRTNWLLAGHAGYAEIRGLFPVLADVCERRPGIVLAPIDAGHWVRYHSECGVIGNVFLVTPQQAAKALETRRLLGLTPAQLLAEPVVTGLHGARSTLRYVLAFHAVSIVPGAREPDLERLRRRMAPLERALLGPLAALPPRFRLVGTAMTPGGQVQARLLEICAPGEPPWNGARAPYNRAGDDFRGFHAVLRVRVLPVRVPRRGLAEDQRRAAQEVSEMRQELAAQAHVRAGFPAQGLGLVRDRLQVRPGEKAQPRGGGQGRSQERGQGRHEGRGCQGGREAGCGRRRHHAGRQARGQAGRVAAREAPQAQAQAQARTEAESAPLTLPRWTGGS